MIFFKYGKIKGGASKDTGHEGYSTVKTVDIGLTRAIDVDDPLRDSDHPAFSDLRITKEPDAATIKLFYEASGGREPQEALIKFVEEGKTAHYLQVTLTDAMISSYSLQAESPETEPEEILHLSFKKIKLVGPGKNAPESGWDRLAHKADPAPK